MDRRTVDELTIEDLERILLLRRRQLRVKRLERLRQMGRYVDDPPPPADGDLLERSIDSQEDKETEHRNADFASSPPLQRGTSAKPHPHKPGTWRDRILLALEIAALVGLMVIAVGSLLNLKTLNEEVVQAREVPTATPTPLIDVAILPGGSQPPPTSNEIPAAYRNLIKPLPTMAIPTPSPQGPTRIVIPSINVDAVVVHGDSWEDLKKGAGHHIGSANPGERGNMIISAHNDVFGEIFRHLEDIELEDKVFVHTNSQAFEYVVKAKRIVEPSDVSVMAPSTRPILTLITCYPYLIDTHRLVVIAELKR